MTRRRTPDAASPVGRPEAAAPPGPGDGRGAARSAADASGTGAEAGSSGGGSSGVDLARVALRAARERARARGSAARQRRQARRGGLRSGARADGRDPVSLGSAVHGLITERGWETPTAVGGVMGRWPELVGPEVARHCQPLRYDEEKRVLTVRCDSTAWATQLRLLAPHLVARLNQSVGQGSVRAIQVRGPGGQPRSPGPLRAPGSRGPGDTYG